jgi:nucleoside diphosphate kinase
MNTKKLSKAVVTGLEQGGADVAAKKMLSAVKKAAGKHYPAVMSTPIGEALEPLVVPAVVGLTAQLVAEALISRVNKQVTWEDVVKSKAANKLDPVYNNAYRIGRVADVAELALTQAVASLTSDELTSAIDFVTSFADDLFTECPVELPETDTK